MDFLYNMGFFGKGSLSRSDPSFDTRHQRVTLPSLDKAGDGAGVVQAVLTSKRKYLAHLRYKALSDDEESLYNDIVQQEQSQLSIYDGEDEDDDEEDMEEDEEYEEEDEDGLENEDIHTLSRYAFKGDRNAKLTPDELYQMPRSLLMAVMTQVALLSKEQIATFVQVPCGLPELETKYRMMRLKQVVFLESVAKHERQQQLQRSSQETSSALSSLLSSLKSRAALSKSDGGGGVVGNDGRSIGGVVSNDGIARGGVVSNDGGGMGSSGDGSRRRGFGKKGIINLEDVDDDAVVILNSDDEKEDGDDDDGGKGRKKSDDESNKKTQSKGWDDSDDEGDVDFWGVGGGEEGKGDEKEGEEKGKEEIASTMSMANDSDSNVKDDGGCGGGGKDTKSEGLIDGKEDGVQEETERVGEAVTKGETKADDSCKDEGHAEKIDGEEGSKGKSQEHIEREECKNDESSACRNDDIKENIDKGDTDELGHVEKPVDSSIKDSVKMADEDGAEIKDEDQSSSVKPTSSLDTLSHPSASSVKSTTDTTAVATDTIASSSENKKDNTNISDEDDDDDVICVEEDSAQPAKLHQYLSQQPSGASSGPRLVVKPVTFLSSISDEPKYVQTRLGFKSWDNVLHFNYTGDTTHLPTGLAVYDDGSDRNNGSKTNLESSLSSSSSLSVAGDASKSSSSSRGCVYERVHPPISSLIASTNSRGSLMKQRHEPVPFLGLALYNLQQRFVPSTSTPLRQPQSRSNGIDPHHRNPSLWSHPGLRNQPKIQSSTSSTLSQSAKPSSSSFNVTVTPSQLQLYLKVFQEDKGSSEIDTEKEEENPKLDSLESGEKDNMDDSDMLPKLRVQLSKTGLLKMQTVSNPVDRGGVDSDDASDESLAKQSALHTFNKMLSGYLESQQISLEQELVLLRILMYDETSVTANAIPRDLVASLKAKISPGQLSCLLERMDFVQICVENRRRDLLSSDDVITIDLSEDDEEEDGEELKEVEDCVTKDGDKCVDKDDDDDGRAKMNENENDKKSKAKGWDDSGDEGDADFWGMGEEKEKGGDGNEKGKEGSADASSGGSREKGDGKETKGESNDKCVQKESGEKRGEDSSSEVNRKETGMDGEKDKGRSSEEGDGGGVVVGVKRQLDSSAEMTGMSESKKRKSEAAVSVGNVSSDVQCGGNLSNLSSLSSVKCDDVRTFQENVAGDSSGVDKDRRELSSSKGGEMNQNDGGDGKESELKKKDVNTVCENNAELDSDSVSRPLGERIDLSDVEMVEDKEEGGLNSKDKGVGAADRKKDGRSNRSVSVNEELNEIYVGSSDDEDEIEEGFHGRRVRGRKDFSENGSKVSSLFCHSDDEDGDNFVIANTSDDEVDNEDDDDDVMMMNNSGERSGWMKGRAGWRPCLKRDPYPTKERLHLMLEEAFFLTFGLGCLRILDQETIPLGIVSLWQRFMLIQEKFIPRYVAYHYFRSRGWVPKSGLKFGCDFTLYREGPPFFHGSYSVVVVPVKAGTLAHMDGEDGELDFSRRWTSWISLSGLNRVTEHVAKDLMVCYVIFPKGLTEEDSKSPKCLSQFKVKEVMVSRWVSSRERENKDQPEEVMP